MDRIELAQFVYFLAQNRKVRDVISALSLKTVLILGRFTEVRKPILETISDQLRARELLPIVFDWEPSASRDLTETVQHLANICRYVVADITDARSVPQELSHIIPFFQSVPVQPLILTAQRPYAMFDHWAWSHISSSRIQRRQWYELICRLHLGAVDLEWIGEIYFFKSLHLSEMTGFGMLQLTLIKEMGWHRQKLWLN